MMKMTDPTINADAERTYVMWDGQKWDCREFDGAFHLTRICNYCEHTTGRVHTRHVVSATVTQDRIDGVAEAIEALSEFGDRFADRVEALRAMAWRPL